MPNYDVCLGGTQTSQHKSPQIMGSGKDLTATPPSIDINSSHNQTEYAMKVTEIKDKIYSIEKKDIKVYIKDLSKSDDDDDAMPAFELVPLGFKNFDKKTQLRSIIEDLYRVSFSYKLHVKDKTSRPKIKVLIRQHKNELTSVTELKAKMEQTTNKLRNDLETSRQTSHHLQEQCRKLETALASLNTSHMSLVKEMAERDERQKERYTELNEKMENLEREMHIGRSTLAACEEKLMHVQGLLADKESEVSEQKLELARIREDVSSLVSTLEEKESKIALVESQVQSNRAEIKIRIVHEEALASKQRELEATLSQQIEELKQNHTAELTTLRQDYKEQLSSLKELGKQQKSSFSHTEGHEATVQTLTIEDSALTPAVESCSRDSLIPSKSHEQSVQKPVVDLIPTIMEPHCTSSALMPYTQSSIQSPLGAPHRGKVMTLPFDHSNRTALHCCFEQAGKNAIIAPHMYSDFCGYSQQPGIHLRDKPASAVLKGGDTLQVHDDHLPLCEVKQPQPKAVPCHSDQQMATVVPAQPIEETTAHIDPPLSEGRSHQQALTISILDDYKSSVNCLPKYLRSPSSDLQSPSRLLSAFQTYLQHRILTSAHPYIHFSCASTKVQQQRVSHFSQNESKRFWAAFCAVRLLKRQVTIDDVHMDQYKTNCRPVLSQTEIVEASFRQGVNTVICPSPTRQGKHSNHRQTVTISCDSDSEIRKDASTVFSAKAIVQDRQCVLPCTPYTQTPEWNSVWQTLCTLQLTKRHASILIDVAKHVDFKPVLVNLCGIVLGLQLTTCAHQANKLSESTMKAPGPVIPVAKILDTKSALPFKAPQSSAATLRAPVAADRHEPPAKTVQKAHHDNIHELENDIILPSDVGSHLSRSYLKVDSALTAVVTTETRSGVAPFVTKLINLNPNLAKAVLPCTSNALAMQNGICLNADPHIGQIKTLLPSETHTKKADISDLALPPVTIDGVHSVGLRTIVSSCNPNPSAAPDTFNTPCTGHGILHTEKPHVFSRELVDLPKTLKKLFLGHQTLPQNNNGKASTSVELVCTKKVTTCAIFSDLYHTQGYGYSLTPTNYHQVITIFIATAAFGSVHPERKAHLLGALQTHLQLLSIALHGDITILTGGNVTAQNVHLDQHNTVVPSCKPEQPITTTALCSVKLWPAICEVTSTTQAHSSRAGFQQRVSRPKHFNTASVRPVQQYCLSEIPCTQSHTGWNKFREALCRLVITKKYVLPTIDVTKYMPFQLLLTNPCGIILDKRLAKCVLDHQAKMPDPANLQAALPKQKEAMAKVKEVLETYSTSCGCLPKNLQVSTVTDVPVYAASRYELQTTTDTMILPQLITSLSEHLPTTCEQISSTSPPLRGQVKHSSHRQPSITGSNSTCTEQQCFGGGDLECLLRSLLCIDDLGLLHVGALGSCLQSILGSTHPLVQVTQALSFQQRPRESSSVFSAKAIVQDRQRVLPCTPYTQTPEWNSVWQTLCTLQLTKRHASILIDVAKHMDFRPVLVNLCGIVLGLQLTTCAHQANKLSESTMKAPGPVISTDCLTKQEEAVAKVKKKTNTSSCCIQSKHLLLSSTKTTTSHRETPAQTVHDAHHENTLAAIGPPCTHTIPPSSDTERPPPLTQTVGEQTSVRVLLSKSKKPPDKFERALEIRGVGEQTNVRVFLSKSKKPPDKFERALGIRIYSKTLAHIIQQQTHFSFDCHSSRTAKTYCHSGGQQKDGGQSKQGGDKQTTKQRDTGWPRQHCVGGTSSPGGSTGDGSGGDDGDDKKPPPVSRGHYTEESEINEGSTVKKKKAKRVENVLEGQFNDTPPKDGILVTPSKTLCQKPKDPCLFTHTDKGYGPASYKLACLSRIRPKEGPHNDGWYTCYPGNKGPPSVMRAHRKFKFRIKRSIALFRGGNLSMSASSDSSSGHSDAQNQPVQEFGRENEQICTEETGNMYPIMLATLGNRDMFPLSSLEQFKSCTLEINPTVGPEGILMGFNGLAECDVFLVNGIDLIPPVQQGTLPAPKHGTLTQQDFKLFVQYSGGLPEIGEVQLEDSDSDSAVLDHYSLLSSQPEQYNWPQHDYNCRNLELDHEASGEYVSVGVPSTNSGQCSEDDSNVALFRGGLSRNRDSEHEHSSSTSTSSSDNHPEEHYPVQESEQDDERRYQNPNGQVLPMLLVKSTSVVQEKSPEGYHKHMELVTIGSQVDFPLNTTEQAGPWNLESDSSAIGSGVLKPFTEQVEISYDHSGDPNNYPAPVQQGAMPEPENGNEVPVQHFKPFVQHYDGLPGIGNVELAPSETSSSDSAAFQPEHYYWPQHDNYSVEDQGSELDHEASSEYVSVGVPSTNSGQCSEDDSDVALFRGGGLSRNRDSEHEHSSSTSTSSSDDHPEEHYPVQESEQDDERRYQNPNGQVLPMLLVKSTSVVQEESPEGYHKPMELVTIGSQVDFPLNTTEQAEPWNLESDSSAIGSGVLKPFTEQVEISYDHSGDPNNYPAPVQQGAMPEPEHGNEVPVQHFKPFVQHYDGLPGIGAVELAPSETCSGDSAAFQPEHYYWPQHDNYSVEDQGSELDHEASSEYVSVGVPSTNSGQCSEDDSDVALFRGGGLSRNRDSEYEHSSSTSTSSSDDHPEEHYPVQESEQDDERRYPTILMPNSLPIQKDGCVQEESMEGHCKPTSMVTPWSKAHPAAKTPQHTAEQCTSESDPTAGPKGDLKHFTEQVEISPGHPCGASNYPAPVQQGAMAGPECNIVVPTQENCKHFYQLLGGVESEAFGSVCLEPSNLSQDSYSVEAISDSGHSHYNSLSSELTSSHHGSSTDNANVSSEFSLPPEPSSLQNVSSAEDESIEYATAEEDDSNVATFRGGDLGKSVSGSDASKNGSTCISPASSGNSQSSNKEGSPHKNTKSHNTSGYQSMSPAGMRENSEIESDAGSVDTSLVCSVSVELAVDLTSTQTLVLGGVANPQIPVSAEIIICNDCLTVYEPQKEHFGTSIDKSKPYDAVSNNDPLPFSWPYEIALADELLTQPGLTPQQEGSEEDVVSSHSEDNTTSPIFPSHIKQQSPIVGRELEPKLFLNPFGPVESTPIGATVLPPVQDEDEWLPSEASSYVSNIQWSVPYQCTPDVQPLAGVVLDYTPHADGKSGTSFNNSEMVAGIIDPLPEHNHSDQSSWAADVNIHTWQYEDAELCHSENSSLLHLNTRPTTVQGHTLHHPVTRVKHRRRASVACLLEIKTAIDDSSGFESDPSGTDTYKLRKATSAVVEGTHVQGAETTSGYDTHGELENVETQSSSVSEAFEVPHGAEDDSELSLESELEDYDSSVHFRLPIAHRPALSSASSPSDKEITVEQSFPGKSDSIDIDSRPHPPHPLPSLPAEGNVFETPVTFEENSYVENTLPVTMKLFVSVAGDN